MLFKMKIEGGGSKMMKRTILWLLVVVFAAGCVSAPYHKAKVRDEAGDVLTVGKVQREIKIGMSSADVIQALGSPNVVTTDEERREVWVYDKVASEATYSRSEGFATLILIGTDRTSGASATTQRTLTVVVKFDAEGKVRDFAYHSSKF